MTNNQTMLAAALLIWLAFKAGQRKGAQTAAIVPTTTAAADPLDWLSAWAK